ncbi:MAG: hypothetical protein ACR2QE_18580 [Acidimicrobiales bacterium]
MVAALDILAGIAFDPTIRGWLVVLTGVFVLMGSVWLLLATNSGVRLGTLLALTGLFGWMAIMGFVWWIYGIGWVGDSPTWQVIDVVEGPLVTSDLDEARDLPDQAVVYDALGNPVALVASSSNAEAQAEFDPALPADQAEGLTDEELAYREVQRAQRIENRSLSDVEALAPELVDEDADVFGGWTLVSTANAGEAQATATAFLVEDGFIEATDPFILAEAYEQGGKEDLPDDPDRWDRIRLSVTNFVPQHPTHWAIVQVQPATAGVTAPGQPPAADIPDENAEVLSVVMVRNLGDRRLPPFLVMLGSTLVFLALAYMLHVRDKDAAARQAAFEADQNG